MMLTAEATVTQPIFTTLDIPRDPDQLTPAWLTAALRSTGTINQAKVTAVRVESMEGVKGLASQMVRVKLRYDQSEANAPTSLLAKLPHTDPTMRQRLNAWYEREGRFYATFAPAINLRTPTCYYNVMDVGRHDYILLLEDLAPAQTGDQIAGCSVEQAKMAMLGLADLHAPYWNSATLDDLTSHSETHAHQATYLERWPTFVEKYGQHLPDVFLEVGARFGAAIPTIWQQLGQSPATLLHGDYRLDNLLFGTSEGAPEGGPSLAVVDWQLMQQGPGPMDVAYFLGSSVVPEMRREHEMALLNLYHAALTQQGVRDYSFDQCLLDYRRSMFRVFSIVVRILAGYDLSSGREALLTATWLERATAALVDLQLQELLPG